MAVLRIHTPVLGREERIFPWDGRPITVGRDEACDLVLLEQAASRHHARFEREGDEIRVIDSDSGNGVWVGDERVAGSRVLHDGDVVRIGETTLTLVLDPHRQPTVIGAAKPSGGEAEASKVIEAEASKVVEAEAPSAPAPSAALPVQAPAPPAFVPPRRPAPMPAASSPSAYSIGSEPTLAGQSGPNILGIHERSAPSSYSIGEAPTLAPRSGPSDGLLASSSSVYSLGDAPAAASRGPDELGSHRPSAGSVYSLGHEATLAPARGPDSLGSHRPSTGSTYSLGHEPVAPARGPEAFVLGPSSRSEYSLGDVSTSEFRGPELLPPAPSFDGALSSSQLGAAPPPPGVIPLAPPRPAPPAPAPVRIDSPPRPPALVAPPVGRSAASSWGEWSGPLPSEARPHRRAAGATLWLGLGLFIGGIVAMIAALAGGYDPSDLRALVDPSVVMGGER